MKIKQLFVWFNNLFLNSHWKCIECFSFRGQRKMHLPKLIAKPCRKPDQTVRMHLHNFSGPNKFRETMPPPFIKQKARSLGESVGLSGFGGGSFKGKDCCQLADMCVLLVEHGFTYSAGLANEPWQELAGGPCPTFSTFHSAFTISTPP